LSLSNATFSPEGKYVGGYRNDESWGDDLFVYEIATGITRNITARLRIPLLEENMPEVSHSKGFQFGGWLAEDTALLIYDNYDIWQVDPTGKKAPVDLTHGRIHHWQFRLATEYYESNVKFIRPGELLLRAFNRATKKSGFYKLDLGSPKSPELLFKGDYVFNMLLNNKKPGLPLKARDANVYLLRRERCDQSPNIFSTIDFKSFTPVSDVYPEKNVNWFTAELLHFRSSDGIKTQAVLYKPDNFDEAKKYPLIIHYYEKKSDELNIYHKPAGPNGELDIPWFASHGYLVLLTDIHYKIGEPGESIYKSVIGAAQYLSRRRYVDKSHIAIQGHSFGGYETNYLTTHSKLFAAAVSSSGVSNLISAYGNIWPSGASEQEYIETRSFRLATTPWQRPDLYVKNSPIFNVGQVVTPILMVHNKMDQNVHFEEGLQFFTALRRAGKRVWMLEYDNGGHGLYRYDYKDYLLRMTQFFDHYLKGSPPPKWMTRGIPAALKGIDDGLELDYEIKTPGPGLLKHRERKKG
jgi:dipeptidyl aminopeptidase/acylaminoacyl peptidase